MPNLELPFTERDQFYRIVWNIVRLIPTGKVATYGQIANFIPCPAKVTPEDYKSYKARWVGNAMATCPRDVPWQRVINSHGKISIREGALTQHKLLEGEGIVFDHQDRINLTAFGWDGPPKEWLKDNHLITNDDPKQLNLFS